MLVNTLKLLQNNTYLQESLVSFSCSFTCHNPLLVLNMQQTDSRNEFPTLENMEMDTNFIPIDQVFISGDNASFIFTTWWKQFPPQKQKNANCSGPNYSISSFFFN